MQFTPQLRTYLRQLVAAALRAPGAAASRGLKGWLRRAKNSSLARRIVLPVLYRYPQLWGPLRRLTEGEVARPALSATLLAPDWSGPLPREFASMPVSARKVLLDLARTDTE
jgi:hypothetical protein